METKKLEIKPLKIDEDELNEVKDLIYDEEKWTLKNIGRITSVLNLSFITIDIDEAFYLIYLLRRYLFDEMMAKIIYEEPDSDAYSKLKKMESLKLLEKINLESLLKLGDKNLIISLFGNYHVSDAELLIKNIFPLEGVVPNKRFNYYSLYRELLLSVPVDNLIFLYGLEDIHNESVYDYIAMQIHRMIPDAQDIYLSCNKENYSFILDKLGVYYMGVFDSTYYIKMLHQELVSFLKTRYPIIINRDVILHPLPVRVEDVTTLEIFNYYTEIELIRFYGSYHPNLESIKNAIRSTPFQNRDIEYIKIKNMNYEKNFKYGVPHGKFIIPGEIGEYKDGLLNGNHILEEDYGWKVNSNFLNGRLHGEQNKYYFYETENKMKMTEKEFYIRDVKVTEKEWSDYKIFTEKVMEQISQMNILPPEIVNILTETLGLDNIKEKKVDHDVITFEEPFSNV